VRDSKKILFVFTKYSMFKNQEYLTNELVNAFLDREIHATVVTYEKSNRLLCEKTTKNSKEFFVGLNSAIKYFKYFVAWPVLFFVMFRIVLRREKYHMLVTNAPLLTMLPVFLLIPFLSIERKWAIIFDLFPIHQVQAGAIPKCLGCVLRWMETVCLNMHDSYGVMGEKNKVAVSDYYQIPKERIYITGIWGVSKTKRDVFKCRKRNSSVRMVFGGQLTAGRRLDFLIEFLDELRRSMPKESITVDIFSSGKVCEKYKSTYKNNDWVCFCNPLDRESYISNLSNYDFGLIVTDENVNLPTLPSKIVDYMNASIDVIAMVEDACELRTDVYRSSKILLLPFSCSDSDIQLVKSAIDARLEGGSCFYSEKLRALFNVKRAVDVLIQ